MDSLKFQLTIDDYVRANRFLLAHSPSIRSRRRKVILFAGLIYLCTGLWLGSRLSADPVTIMAVGAIFMLGTMIPLWYLREWITARSIRKLMEEANNRGALGERELQIDAEGISVRSPVSNSRILWSGIERFIEERAFAFIYISSIQAVTIPKQEVFSGKPQEFIKQAKQYWLAANPGKTVEIVR